MKRFTNFNLIQSQLIVNKGDSFFFKKFCVLSGFNKNEIGDSKKSKRRSKVSFDELKCIRSLQQTKQKRNAKLSTQ